MASVDLRDMTPDLAALVERLKARGQSHMSYVNRGSVTFTQGVKGDPDCALAAAAIQRLSADLEHEKAMHKVLGGKFETAIEEQKRLQSDLVAAVLRQARLRKVLEFYRDEWRSNATGDLQEAHLTMVWQEPTEKLLEDAGRLAHVALAAPGDGG